MKHGWFRALLALFLFHGLLHAGVRPDGAAFVGAQDRVELRESAAPSTLPAVLEGRVLTPQGLPAEGAVVVSSAGGKSVTDAHGLFSLEIERPRDAREVQITAVQAGTDTSLLASIAVPLLHAGGTVPVGTLRLQQGVSCQPSWLPTFGGGPGVNTDLGEGVNALTVYDDGSGGRPALYIGGEFTSAGGVEANYIARWEGSSWSPLGTGIDGPPSWVRVYALAVYDDSLGGGPALYAGGYFTSAGGVAANSIARWDGSSWAPLSSGTAGFVRALAVYDDGGGPQLYVGGTFNTAGGIPGNDIARWDGTKWSSVGNGMNGESVDALTVYDDGSGSGPALYAGGEFATAGANNIRRWDGTSWSSLGSGMNDRVLALTVYDDGAGGGPDLYAGGEFTLAGGVTASHMARWNGSSWSAVGSGMDNNVHSLTVYDDGSGNGPALYAGGEFTTAGGAAADRIARWNGVSWSPLGGGINHFGVRALTVYDDGSGAGPALYAGGQFASAGGVPANRIARWEGSTWSSLGNGLNRYVQALTVYDDGSGGGPALYAGGAFTGAGGVLVSYVARWDGSVWSSLGGGMDGSVRALTVYDDGLGGGAALYAGGYFTSSGGPNVARWNGATWSSLGSGIDDGVLALAVYDDGSGSGPELYAGGVFTTASGVAANRIAKWDGSSWSSLGSGMSGSGLYTAVYALAVYDDGNGPELYAGGRFVQAGGVAATYIAKWDGSVWSPVGGGVSDRANALTVYDDGSGSGAKLYAGGWLLQAGGAPAHFIASWDGSSWSPVGSGVSNVVYALTVHDEGIGNGAALYAGGYFATAGGVAANRIARWDGATWSPLGSGMDDAVMALASHDDGSGGGQALFAGGVFTVSPAGDSFLAKWGCPGAGDVAYCFGDGSGTPCPCGNTGGTGEGCANSTGSGAVIVASGSNSVSADDLGFAADNLVPNQSALLFAGTNAVNGGNGANFGDGLRCAGMNVIRLGVEIPDGAGTANWGPGLAARGGWQTGDTRYFQVWYRDPGGSPCGFGFNLSHGLSVVFVP